MKEFFGTLIGLIPIAAIIGIQLFAAMRKRRSQQDHPPRQAEVLPEKDEDDEDSFTPHWEKLTGSAAHPTQFPAASPAKFSAESPFPRPVITIRSGEHDQQTREPARQTAYRPADRKEAAHTVSKTPAAKAAYSFYDDTPALGTLAASEARRDQQNFPRNGEPDNRERAPETAGADGDFFKNLEQYTPLQRAVILAEIFGPLRD
jgi:type IV secretory pathway VirB10-like protein